MDIILRRQLIAVSVIMQALFIWGSTFSFTAYILPQLRERVSINFQISEDNISMIGISSVILTPIGAFFNIYTINKFGRRGTMQIIWAMTCTGWLVVASSLSAMSIIIGRGIISFSIGMHTTADVYISEICTNKHRANFAACIGPALTLAGAVTYLLMYLFQWRITAVILAIHCAIMLAIQSYFIPESKHWCILKGRINQAKKSIIWFTNCSDEDATLEINEILSSGSSIATNTLKTKYKKFFEPFILKRFLAITGLHIVIQWSGYYVLNSYALDIFKKQLKTPYNPEILSLIYSFVSFFSSILLVFVIQFFNRKIIVISSSLAMGVSMESLLFYRIILQPDTDIPSLPIICCMGLAVFYNLGAGEIPWLIIAELFPTIVRGEIAQIISIFFYISNALSVWTYPFISKNFSFEWLIGLFATSSVCSALICACFIPETREQPLHLIGIQKIHIKSGD